jgi:transposase
MLYLGIDLHRKQLTVSVRNEKGDVILRRQVSTRWERVREFLEWIKAEAEREGGFVAILETCGFEDWLIGLLKEYGCREVVLIQPEKRSKKKTDRRDAHAMSELLWVNRQRLLASQKIQGVRQVRLVTAEEQQDRQITATRQRAGRQRTRTINQIKYILRRHNLEWECPTKTFETKKVRKWLREVALPTVERLEMNHLLTQWDLWDQQIEELEKVIVERFQKNATAQILATAPGVSAYSGLALAARIGPIENFPRPRSLANYWGLTPGCRNSGEATDRLGSITKQGSPMARFILGQLVIHVLRKDAWMRAWYGRIKRRRGSKIARVAVMRRLATIFWHMVKHNERYVAGGPPRLRCRRSDAAQKAA